MVSACVFGLPEEVLGEQVCAAVQMGLGDTVSEQDLREFVAERLANYKMPTKIWTRTKPLPTGATGKVLKKEIKAHYAEQS